MRKIPVLLTNLLAMTLVAGAATPLAAHGDGEAIVPPVVFSGSLRCVGVVDGGRADVQPEITLNRGEIYQVEADISDERLAGSHTVFFNSDNFKTPGSATSIGRGTWRIENGDGVWQGSFDVIGLPADGSVETTRTTYPLIGEDGYAGLTAIWEANFDNRACSWQVRGLIVSTELPPIPTATLPD